MNSIYLPLHYGKAPKWLLVRMKKLAEPIIKIIIEEFGEKEFFNRMANPIFFQSFSNVLGFDWNSSGATTVLTGVLKSVLNSNPDFSIKVAGGKGKEGLKTPEHIKTLASEIGLSDKKIEDLITSSRFAAKIDSLAIQDGYDIYHHCVIFSDKRFLVIQQGMNEAKRMARRYHWLPNFKLKCEGQHSGIITEKKEKLVIDLTSKESRENRKTSLDLIKEGRVKKDYRKLLSIIKYRDGVSVPRKVNWKAIELAYNLQPSRFEELVLVRGLGKGTIRALALISDLIYCKEYSKQDPAKYCFAVGGKDGVPYPVDRESYDEAIEFLRDVLKQANLHSFEKLKKMRELIG